MMKSLLFIAVLVFMSSLGFSQDTTALRWAGFSDGGEMIYFHDDTTNMHYASVVVGGNSSYVGLFHHPNGSLIALVDSVYGVGDRRFYAFEPFMGTVTEILNPNATYLASACVTPAGRVFAITGNGGTPGEIYEFNFSTMTDSLFMTVPYSLTQNEAVNLTYLPNTDELAILNGSIDSVIIVNIANKTFQKNAANLATDGNLKATYLDGNTLVVASDTLYTTDITSGFTLAGSLVSIPDYMADLENLDLITPDDSVFICQGVTDTIHSRFVSPEYKWYKDGLFTGDTTSWLAVSAAGTYKLLVRMHTDSLIYMWSENMYVVDGTPVSLISVLDTVQAGSAVSFSNTGTQATASWSFGDGNTATGNQVSNIYAAPGNYWVTLTVTQGPCTAIDSFEIVVVQPVSIDQQLSNGLSWSTVYPNPTANSLQTVVNAPSAGTCVLVIRDLQGRIVLKNAGINLNAGANTVNLDVSPLKSGVYLMSLEKESGRLVQRVSVMK